MHTHIYIYINVGWRMTNMFLFCHRVTVIKAHRRRVSACVTDPSARVIASTSWDGTVKFWRARDGQPESDLPSRGSVG